jgi:hypothetical protein
LNTPILYVISRIVSQRSQRTRPIGLVHIAIFFSLWLLSFMKNFYMKRLRNVAQRDSIKWKCRRRGRFRLVWPIFFIICIRRRERIGIINSSCERGKDAFWIEINALRSWWTINFDCCMISFLFTMLFNCRDRWERNKLIKTLIVDQLYWTLIKGYAVAKMMTIIPLIT